MSAHHFQLQQYLSQIHTIKTIFTLAIHQVLDFSWPPDNRKRGQWFKNNSLCTLKVIMQPCIITMQHQSRSLTRGGKQHICSVMYFCWFLFYICAWSYMICFYADFGDKPNVLIKQNRFSLRYTFNILCNICVTVGCYN